jgi:hypothetical protein
MADGWLAWTATYRPILDSMQVAAPRDVEALAELLDEAEAACHWAIAHPADADAWSGAVRVTAQAKEVVASWSCLLAGKPWNDSAIEPFQHYLFGWAYRHDAEFRLKVKRAFNGIAESLDLPTVSERPALRVVKP